MAKQDSIINILGTLNGLTFYKTQDGYIVRKKGGFTTSRIATDPVFARTRENSKEFGNAAKAGKLLRTALSNLMLNASDNRVTPRLTQVMRNLLNSDTTSERGKRNVATAILDAPAQEMLNGFNFNKNAVLSSVLKKAFTVDVVTGIIEINGLIPLKDIVCPKGATNVTFKGAWVKLDFANEKYEVVNSNVIDLPIDNTPTVVTLTPNGTPPKLTGTTVFAMNIEFMQLVNGQEYSMNNGTFNSLCIVDVK